MCVVCNVLYGDWCCGWMQCMCVCIWVWCGLIDVTRKENMQGKCVSMSMWCVWLSVSWIPSGPMLHFQVSLFLASINYDRVRILKRSLDIACLYHTSVHLWCFLPAIPPPRFLWWPVLDMPILLMGIMLRRSLCRDVALMRGRLCMLVSSLAYQ